MRLVSLTEHTKLYTSDEAKSGCGELWADICDDTSCSSCVSIFERRLERDKPLEVAWCRDCCRMVPRRHSKPLFSWRSSLADLAMRAANRLRR